MKKFLLSLFVGFIGFISFGYCGRIYFSSSNINGFYSTNFSTSSYKQGNFVQLYYCTIPANCYYYVADYTNTYTLSILSSSELNTLANGTNYISILGSSCSNYLSCSNVSSKSLSASDCPSCPDCPVCEEQYTSLECQSEYGLIPINEVTENYCVTNGLCPSNVVTGEDLSGVNWSSLYINDIQHVSAPLIDITIPEEFNWDYTGNDEVFELSVEGYNVDTEYIAGIINTQNTKPTQNDLNDIINKVLPLFIPGLVIILFIYFVFRFIKKIF